MNPGQYQFPTSSFARGVSPDLLARQIVDAALEQVLIGIDIAEDEVIVTFAGALIPSSEATLDAIAAAHDPTGYTFAKNYLEEVYLAGRLQRRTWYAYKKNDAFMYKVTEETLTFDPTGVYLVTELAVEYGPLGDVVKSTTYVFSTIQQNDGTILIRKEITP